MASYKVTASALNIRSGPSTNYKKVSTLYQGDIVDVISIDDGWAKIGTSKYVSAQYLLEVNSSSSDRLEPSYKPISNLDNRPIYLMQTDSRWKRKMYSSVNNKSQTIGSSGCGPSAVSMIINEWFDPTYGPVEACAWSVANGYRHATNGTYWGLMKAIAVKYGCKFSQVYSGAEAKKWLDNNPGSLVVCIMGKGNWTKSGHFILMYKCDGTYVYINDPNSTKFTRQKNTFSLLKSECRCYFCFAKPENLEDATAWADKSKVETIKQNGMVVAAETLICRKNPTTSDGDNGVGNFDEGVLVTATKKCGDWFYVTGTSDEGKKISGWCPATYLEDADINNVASSVATEAAYSIDYLVEIGFLDSPDYWRETVFDMSYLSDLIIKIVYYMRDYKIKFNLNVKDMDDVNEAIEVLVDHGVINTPDYWEKNYSLVKNVDILIKRAAAWLEA